MNIIEKFKNCDIMKLIKRFTISIGGVLMRIIVFSDTHGSIGAANKVFELNRNVCDHFIFLGDGLKEIELVKEMYPEKNIYCVSGNCDAPTIPSSNVIEIFKTRIFMTHGHHFNVKTSHDDLIKAAKENNAVIALYGHTHCRYYKYENGLHILNPGSAAQPKDGLPPCYAFIDLTPMGISCALVDL